MIQGMRNVHLGIFIFLWCIDKLSTLNCKCDSCRNGKRTWTVSTYVSMSIEVTTNAKVSWRVGVQGRRGGDTGEDAGGWDIPFNNLRNFFRFSLRLNFKEEHRGQQLDLGDSFNSIVDVFLLIFFHIIRCPILQTI